MLRTTERWIKGPLFGCRMCGNCLLQETAFICPMECPKGMRNGPCGGSTPDKCYVDETRPCIWYKIYERAHKWAGRRFCWKCCLPWTGTRWAPKPGGMWCDPFEVTEPWHLSVTDSPEERKKAAKLGSCFQPVRQPDWWTGDGAYHPPAYEEPVSRLESALHSGKFVLTAEVSPPLSTATGKLKRDIEMMGGLVTAVNFTDSASASPRMSSMACSKIAAEMGADPVSR
jgi:hypothetical protein